MRTSPAPRASSDEQREVRDLVADLELRAPADGSRSPGTLVGYAAVFNKVSVDLSFFREQIAPGAFSGSLARCDVRALFNHDPSCMLGRTSAGTLRLAEDDRGLKMECDLPDTQLGRDVAELVRRRDIQGQSFAFTTAVAEMNWKEDPPLRTLIEVDELFDVGPVTYPAYEETSVALRWFQAQTEARNQAQARARVQPAGDPPAGASSTSIPAEFAAAQAQRHAARLRLLEVF